MYLDIREMQAFYTSRLGRVTQRLLNAQIVALWPDMADRPLTGFGYTLPFMAGHTSAIAILPERQGITAWPRPTPTHREPNRAALSDDRHLPLADNSVERLLVCHALENADDMRRFLREIWRVLAPEGRVLIVVPHRHSLWPLSERTPFGHGRPFSALQLETLLKDHLFTPLQRSGALYGWPGKGRFAARLLGVAERLGGGSCRLAGVMLMEARKSVAAPIDGRLGEAVPDYAPA